MRLVFSNADEDTIDRYRDLLPRAAAAWAARRYAASAPGWALCEVVAFKLGEEDRGGDGLVARWTAADVSALLEHWLPARQAPPGDGTRAVPGALRIWWAFLRERGWFDPRSAPLKELERAVRTAAARFADTSARYGHTAERASGMLCSPNAMGPSRLETADKLTGGAGTGVSAPPETGSFALSGGSAVPARRPDAAGRCGLVFAALTAAVADESAQAVSDTPPRSAGRWSRRLPPVQLPSPQELAAAVAASPALAVPDAAEPARSPGGAEAARPESAAAADALKRWWNRFAAVRAATEARLNGGAAQAPVDVQQDSVAPDRGAADGGISTPAADAVLGAVLTAAGLGRERGAPVSVIPRMAADVLAALPLPHTGAPLPWSRFNNGAHGIVAAAGFLLGDLEQLGAVARLPSPADPAGTAAPCAVLTPLGRWLWFTALASLGTRPCTHAELMAENAEVLIDRAASGAPFGEQELREWIDARGAARALPELIEVYRRSDDCVHRSLVDRVTAGYALQARTCYEALRADTEFGGWARSWLFDAGFAKRDSLEPLDHLSPLLDGLAASLRTGTYGCGEGSGAPAYVSEAELPAVFDTAAGCGHPESRFVLSWFARHHPDHRIRAAARTARTALTSARG